MEAMAVVLRRLQEEIAWFVRAAEVRLLHVTTDGAMRSPALNLLTGYEHHADNRGLFFRLDDPYEGADAGWSARVQRLKDQLSEKTRTLAPADIHLRPLAEPGGVTRAGSDEFVSVLRRLGDVLVPPLTELVVVMAPVRVTDPALFAQEMAALIGSRVLGHVRWIVVEADGVALAPFVAQLGAAALTCSCAVDPRAEQEELQAMGAATVADLSVPAAGDSRVAGAWRAAGAVPDVAPPPRVGAQPVAPSEAALRAAGLSPRFVNGGGQVLKKLLLGGALAMRQGKMSDACTLQARAAGLCAEMEMPREQIVNLHVLGGYQLAASQPDRARKTYIEAGALARQHGLIDIEAQNELALGMLDAVAGRIPEAAAHYAAAGRLAETAKVEPLAIDCWRMAGQLALDSQLEPSAIECWKRALRVAGALEPALAQTTSAAEVARALAAICRRRGFVAQAQSLEQQSVALEQGAPGTGAAVATTS